MSSLGRRSAWALATVAGVLAAIAAAGRFYEPLATIEWMILHGRSDFHDAGDLWDFLVGLRTAIPPIYAAAEIAGLLLLGDIRVPLAIAYYGSLLACFVIAVDLQHSTGERLASIGLSMVLAAGVTASHVANPQPYDLYVPALATVLLALALAPPSRWPAWAAVGVALAMLELSRPFMLAGAAILAVPLIRLAARQGRGAIVALLLPVALLSGGWHAKLLAVHGQLLISDHGAFNVADALASVGFVVPPPPMEPEVPGPAGGIWIDLNSDVHARNNAALSRALLAAIVRHPLAAAEAAGQRLWLFLTLPAVMFGHDLVAPILTPYRWLVRIGIVLSLLAFAGLAIRRGWRVVYDPVGSFLLYSGFVLVSVAVGTAYEEIRLVAELAPTLALLPLYFRTVLEPAVARPIAGRICSTPMPTGSNNLSEALPPPPHESAPRHRPPHASVMVQVGLLANRVPPPHSVATAPSDPP